MNTPNVLRRLSVILPLVGIVSFVAVAGCGDDTVRGAGSIDVPRPAAFKLPEKSASRRGETASIPVRAH